MKKYILCLSFLTTAGLMLSSCSDDDLSDKSVIVTSETEQTQFDKWLEANFVNPYNIQFKYRYEHNESDMNYYNVPADYKQAVELAHIVKYTCVEAYDEVAVCLSKGMIYNDILAETGASSATISRVNRSLQYGKDGYEVAFNRLAEQKED